ncbi:MAG TPA: hypothetical protein VE987_22395 [Polyangiaceae bacterium]|nr:hypothetical protein [Polyangiaceae bacterium]
MTSHLRSEWGTARPPRARAPELRASAAAALACDEIDRVARFTNAHTPTVPSHA